jgi:hypothetical protein
MGDPKVGRGALRPVLNVVIRSALMLWLWLPGLSSMYSGHSGLMSYGYGGLGYRTIEVNRGGFGHGAFRPRELICTLALTSACTLGFLQGVYRSFRRPSPEKDQAKAGRVDDLA